MSSSLFQKLLILSLSPGLAITCLKIIAMATTSDTEANFTQNAKAWNALKSFPINDREESSVLTSARPVKRRLEIVFMHQGSTIKPF